MIITTHFILAFILAMILAITSLFADLYARHKKLSPTTLKILHHVFGILILLAIIGMGISNFQVMLTALTFGTGFIILIDRIFFYKKRKVQQQSQPLIVEQSYSFFGVLLLVWVIRSFLIQPYRVPTGSLEPTVAPGDFLVVNQFAYGLHFPLGNKKFLDISEPKRGDIVVFYYPPDPNTVYVKRLIGLPGDHIESRNKVLYINGIEMTQTDIADHHATTTDVLGQAIPVEEKSEDLDGVVHRIYIAKNGSLYPNFDITVPAGNYFMIGDNRDNSGDSRAWGFVPQENLIGKAFAIWMSWDAQTHKPRWNRIGMGVH